MAPSQTTAASSQKRPPLHCQRARITAPQPTLITKNVATIGRMLRNQTRGSPRRRVYSRRTLFWDGPTPTRSRDYVKNRTNHVQYEQCCRRSNERPSRPFCYLFWLARFLHRTSLAFRRSSNTAFSETCPNRTHDSLNQLRSQPFGNSGMF
jgi:hypothetical protein